MSEPTGTHPFSAFEWMLSLRYLRARRKEGFISVIVGFSLPRQQLQGGGALAQRAITGLLAATGRHEADRSVGNVASLRCAPHQP